MRYAVFGVVLLAALAAFGSWLVRTRRISPFSAFGRGLRSVTDPVLGPLERRVVRMGGNRELARVLPTMHVHLVRVQFRPLTSVNEKDRLKDYRRVTEAVLDKNGSYGEWPVDFGSIELDLQAKYMDSVDRRSASEKR